MKAIYPFCLLFFITQISFSNSNFCPDAPSNDNPCVTSDNPPIDLTAIGSHEGTTCCATIDIENVDCSAATDGASVWYSYTPDIEMDPGFDVTFESDEGGGPFTIELYTGLPDAGCTEALTLIESTCNVTNDVIKVGNCIAADDVIFIKVTSDEDEENCGAFTISVSSAECEYFSVDNCIELTNHPPIFLEVEEPFGINYNCVYGCLDYACPETDSLGGCPEFMEMPTVWFHVITEDGGAQMFTTIEPNGNWEAIWTVYSGPDCDNMSAVNFGGTPVCSNGDNTPDLHQNSIFDDENNYWISVTVDPASVPPSGIDDGSFEMCLAATVNAIICLGELEGGACEDESLVIEITDRDNEDLSLDGPFCPGEEVEVNISFFYDATESGADWFIGFVPIFGPGWDMEEYDYTSNVPYGNGMPGIWYEEGSDIAPIIREDVPILCTYRDEYGNLQLCNLLCSPCSECPQPFMIEDDPLPSGYFWVSNGGNTGCQNDGSPGEGWGIGSTQAQIDWNFKLKVKEFEDLNDCADKNDLFISFQTFSDGVAGCWEDPVGECLLDRAMFSTNWKIGCTELPAKVTAQDVEACTKQISDIALSMEDGSLNTIVVKAVDNLFITGANDHVFENGVGVIADFLVNNSTEDQIIQYEVYAVDSLLTCNGPKTLVEVLVRSQYLEELEDAVCECTDGCTMIGIASDVGSTYQWSTGDNTNMIEVCPVIPTSYSLTVTDAMGCERIGSVLVDCTGLDEDCYEPVLYKLITDFYIDVNEDGVRDSLDISFEQGSFLLEPELVLIYNTTASEDTLLLEEGEYTLTYVQGNLHNHLLTTDSIVSVTLDSTQNCVKVEFGLTPDISLIRNVNIYHNLIHRCNSERTFTLYARNNGNIEESGILWATLDEDILPDDFPASAAIDTFIAPNTMGWFFEDLLPGGLISKSLEVYIPGPPDVPVGWVVDHKIFIELLNANGTTEIWKEKDITVSILCSYDPNDKAVEPAHVEGYTDIEEDELVFKIRFQNTGNAPAEKIEIRDTLSEFLNVNSVQYIAGSHDEFLTFSRREDRILIFNFDNINLPDSTADLAGSQGYLIYSATINEDVEVGTLIENTAHIYFDNNPAVVTNTTKNILYPDMDNDGYFSIEDCNEEDMNINPGADEIPNNDVDEDCDGIALVIDEDMDGFNSDEDCDDNNAEINPDAEEVINNDVDENCDGVALIIDEDMDGFNSDEDCDDTNAEINPDAEEIINNDVDENCDDLVVVIDVDMDGFNSDEDCDDENAEINPDAEDIPGNGIDENCDGEDAVVIGVSEELLQGISIRPNPSNDAFNVSLNVAEEVDFIIRDLMGREVSRGRISSLNKTIYLGEQPNGVYLMILTHSESKKSAFHKLLKI